MSVYNYRNGIQNAPSYQVSGKPFVSGSLSIAPSDPPIKISFPQITRWIMIVNHDDESGARQRALRIGFSENGLPSSGGTNYFTMWDGTSTYTYWQLPRLELKVTEIWIEGHSEKFDVIAGLTGLDSDLLPNNWSGSSGVG